MQKVYKFLRDDSGAIATEYFSMITVLPQPIGLAAIYLPLKKGPVHLSDKVSGENFGQTGRILDALTPALSPVEVGCFRLRPLFSAELG